MFFLPWSWLYVYLQSCLCHISAKRRGRRPVFTSPRHRDAWSNKRSVVPQCVSASKADRNICENRHDGGSHGGPKFHRSPLISYLLWGFHTAKGNKVMSGGAEETGKEQTCRERDQGSENSWTGQRRVRLFARMRACFRRVSHLAFSDYWFSWSRFPHTTCWASVVWLAPWSPAGSSLSAPCRKTENCIQ